MAADQGNITTPDAGDLNAAAKKYAASQGWAMPEGSYTIRPANNHGRADAEKAVKAVGRGGKSHDAIRKHVMSRLKAIGLSDLIPDNWSSDGSLREYTMGDMERRYTPVVVEVRAGSGGPKRIGGYAAVFGKLSRNLGGFVENVGGGAFNQSRANGWQGAVARYNHDSNMILGTTGGRTLDLRIDNVGLDYEVTPPQARADIVELVERGDVQHSSFAFRVLSGGDEWTVTEQNYPMRTLHEVQLVDVAPVHDPAYPDATAGLRSLAEHMQAPLDEVRSMAEADELRRFFIRTDTQSTKSPQKRTFGPAAMAELLARKQDPYAE